MLEGAEDRFPCLERPKPQHELGDDLGDYSVVCQVMLMLQYPVRARGSTLTWIGRGAIAGQHARRPCAARSLERALEKPRGRPVDNPAGRRSANRRSDWHIPPRSPQPSALSRVSRKNHIDDSMIQSDRPSTRQRTGPVPRSAMPTRPRATPRAHGCRWRRPMAIGCRRTRRAARAGICRGEVLQHDVRAGVAREHPSIAPR